MDLASGDDDPVAAAAAALAGAPDDGLAVRLLSTPDRPKRPITTTSGSTTPSNSYFSYAAEYRHRYHDHDQDEDDHGLPHDPETPGLRTPSLLSSPSVVSSLGYSTGGRMSPLRNELSRPPSGHCQESSADSPLPFARSSTRSKRSSRDALARRLTHLAHQLTTSVTDDVVDDDGVDILTTQLDRLEESMMAKRSRSPTPPRSLFSSPVSPSARPTPDGPGSFEMRSPGESIFSSPASSLFRSRFSDLSASILRDRERQPEPEPEPEPPRAPGMTVAQAKKIIVESTKLNDELSQLVTNLKARQEESDHIHSLLVERAERAAQRIIFLQTRISHLEQELHENDDELQHLRISLKAVEIQMPPHPDKELQRCIANFKQDYQALKRKRANRSFFSNHSAQCATESTRTGSLLTGSTYPGSPPQ